MEVRLEIEAHAKFKGRTLAICFCQLGPTSQRLHNLQHSTWNKFSSRSLRRTFQIQSIESSSLLIFFSFAWCVMFFYCLLDMLHAFTIYRSYWTLISDLLCYIHSASRTLNFQNSQSAQIMLPVRNSLCQGSLYLPTPNTKHLLFYLLP